MPVPYIGEVRMMAGDVVPNGFVKCNGQLMPIAQNQALFSKLGTTYGGDGVTTFALPDLRGAAAMHFGGGHTQGEKAGEQAHTVTQSEMPTHAHVAQASGANADANAASNNILAVSQGLIYMNPTQVQPTLVPLNTQTVTNVGGSQAHLNMQPFLTINFMIALQGIFY